MTGLRWSDDRRTPFAQRMRAARAHSTFSQKEAAARIGISQPTISELESSAIKSGHTAKAAQVYKVNPLWLQDGSGEMLGAAPTFSARAALLASMLDQITDQDEFDRACVLCETFAALGQDGQLRAVTRQIVIAEPAPEPTAKPVLGRASQTAADPPKRT